jgi:hypothetical protein
MGYPAENLDGDSNPVPPWARDLVKPLPRSSATPTAEETRNRSLAFRYRAFSGNRAMLVLQQQLALQPRIVPVPVEETQDFWAIMKRLCAVIGVAALIVWGVIALHPMQSGGHQAVMSDDTPESTAAKRVKVVEIRPPTAVPVLVDNSPVPPVDPSVPTLEPMPTSGTHSQISSSALLQTESVAPAGTSVSPVPPPESVAASAPLVPPRELAAGSGTPVPLPESPAGAGTPVPLSGSARSGPAPVSDASVSLSEPSPSSGAAVPMPALPPAASAPVQPTLGPVPAPAPSQAGSAAVGLSNEEVASLIKRGNDILKVGDVSSARALLRRAATAGSAEAAFTLGTTFDPLVLRQMGVIGIEPDVVQARQWYEKAAALGSAVASQQLAKLKGR